MDLLTINVPIINVLLLTENAVPNKVDNLTRERNGKMLNDLLNVVLIIESDESRANKQVFIRFGVKVLSQLVNLLLNLFNLHLIDGWCFIFHLLEKHSPIRWRHVVDTFIICVSLSDAFALQEPLFVLLHIVTPGLNVVESSDPLHYLFDVIGIINFLDCDKREDFLEVLLQLILTDLERNVGDEHCEVSWCDVTLINASLYLMLVPSKRNRQDKYQQYAAGCNAHENIHSPALVCLFGFTEGAKRDSGDEGRFTIICDPLVSIRLNHSNDDSVDTLEEEEHEHDDHCEDLERVE